MRQRLAPAIERGTATLRDADFAGSRASSLRMHSQAATSASPERVSSSPAHLAPADRHQSPRQARAGAAMPFRQPRAPRSERNRGRLQSLDGAATHWFVQHPHMITVSASSDRALPPGRSRKGGEALLLDKPWLRGGRTPPRISDASYRGASRLLEECLDAGRVSRHPAKVADAVRVQITGATTRTRWTHQPRGSAGWLLACDRWRCPVLRTRSHSGGGSRSACRPRPAPCDQRASPKCVRTNGSVLE